MSKAIKDLNDIVGNKYGFLKVESYVETVKKGRQTEHYYDCSCKCGATHIVTTRHILLKGDKRSCGCAHASAGKERTEDLSGQHFGRWEVLEQAETRYSKSGKTRSIMWKCRCSCERGTVKNVGARALKTGMSQSCGCLQKEIMSKIATDDLSEQRFGFLVVKERAGSKKSKYSSRAVWKCECDCGKITYATGELLKNGDVTSCGCKKSSKYELYVKQYLEQLGYVEDVDFIREKTFPDLIGTSGLLRFDFFIEGKNDKPSIAIECQGEQHFKPVEWYGGETYFKKLQSHDKIKRQYASSHNIELIEIPYTKVLFDDIVSFLKEHNVY